MLRDLAGRKVHLILDGHPVHHAKLVSGWVAQRPTRIELHFLPGYSPELNPVELLNNDVKAGAAGRRRTRSVVELTGELRVRAASAAAPGGGRGVLCASGYVLCRRPVNTLFASQGINAWTYATSGCWQATEHDGHGLEFILTANQELDRCVELLAINAYYHAGPPSQRLDHGHTVNFGEPWLPGSSLDHALISLPYPYGPELEICAWDGGHARLLWLLPISRAERDFKRDYGLEALEQRFEQAQLDYTNPQRASVV